MVQNSFSLCFVVMVQIVMLLMLNDKFSFLGWVRNLPLIELDVFVLALLPLTAVCYGQKRVRNQSDQ